jgi:hypothetical protein
MTANRIRENRPSGMIGGLAETWAMVELGTRRTYRKGAGWKLSASRCARRISIPTVKSIGGKRIRSGDPAVLPQGEAGLSDVSEFGIRNVEFGILCFFFSILHSALCIPHFNCPPGPRNGARLMVFARNALAFGPGNA